MPPYYMVAFFYKLTRLIGSHLSAKSDKITIVIVALQLRDSIKLTANRGR